MTISVRHHSKSDIWDVCVRPVSPLLFVGVEGVIWDATLDLKHVCVQISSLPHRTER